MTHRYVVIGAGRQGTAAAYDLGRHGGASEVVIADCDAAVAERASRRVNRLLSRSIATAAAVDATKPETLRNLLEAADSCVSAVPYFLNLDITRAAIDSGTHYCDLGGNTALVRSQLELDPAAREAGVSVIPDCGQVPGMGTSLMVYTMEQLDDPEEVRMWDGGLPQEPQEPWNYALTFNIAGLTNEYDGRATFLRGGELTEVDCFDPAGYEVVEFPPPFGRLEAFVTAGGTSTAPWTFSGKLRTFENRTLRYPGHAAQWKAFRDAGLFAQHPIEVDGVRVIPRQ
ncbi:MAG: saccharopine dehydrogenase NADP-binding domain-containing protein, partial [Acidobacteriota bacterium]|nr:saccharopine dehydrogenase NADP-binding domain-containing protein [Acidobacteriota bacterium]